MSDWTAGYVADVDYTYGYYTELNPIRARLAFLNAGLVCPAFGTACELGFGQGLSTNIHAAASVTQWHGTDFNPAQAGFAQELAAASGASAALYDEAFAEFANRADLPDFDYIGLHGIWSWISDANRAVIVDFVRRKLKVGGVLFVSYNTQPGWSTFAPVRHLMTEHARHMGSEGQGIIKRIDGALEFSEKLLASNPAYARANPQAVTRLQKAKDMNRNYLAHEYFNRDWHPMYFSNFADWMAPGKVTFACSAHPLDHVEIINMTADQLKMLRETSDPVFRETVRDFMMNQQFRRDYWVKGVRTLNKLEREQGLMDLRIILISPQQDVSLKVSGGMGEVTLREDVYKPVLEALGDHRVHTLGEIARAVASKGVLPTQLPEIVLILAGTGHVMLAQDDAVAAKARAGSRRLNAHLMQKARAGNDIGSLASPVTGGGVGVNRFQQLFLLARAAGLKTAAEWASSGWQVLSAQGQKIIKEGKTLETVEENLAELRRLADLFEQKSLPILVNLGVA